MRERIILARGLLVLVESLGGLCGSVASGFVKVSKYDLCRSEPKFGGTVEKFDCVGATARCVAALQRIHPLFIQLMRIPPSSLGLRIYYSTNS